MDKFTLTIALGNDAMQTPADVAAALLALAARLDSLAWIHDAGVARDENGNTVGKWELS